MPSDAGLLAGYAACAAVTRQKAKSFHFASTFLPAAKRRGVFALYDFCRYVDDIVDERGERSVAAVRLELAELAAMVATLPTLAVAPSARWAPLHDTVRRFEVPVAPMLELIAGMDFDLDFVSMPDAPTLLTYCHQVAGVVGLMLGPLLGATSHDFDEAGAALGTAMQLTNVLRDVSQDLERGRVYLPASELAAYGLTRRELGQLSPAWREFMAFQVARAREYYAAGDRVIGLFPPDGSRLTVRLMQRTYAGILTDIERRNYDVFSGRAHVNGKGKLVILGRALWDAPSASPLKRALGR